MALLRSFAPKENKEIGVWGGNNLQNKLDQEKASVNMEEVTAYLYADGNDATKCKKLLDPYL